MSRARDAVLARRAALVARTDAERDELALALEPWRRAIGAADRALAWFRAVGRNAPLLVIGVAALGALVASRGGMAWVRRAQSAWRPGRTILGFIAAWRG